MSRLLALVLVTIICGCSKSSSEPDPGPPDPGPPVLFALTNWTIGSTLSKTENYNVPSNAPIVFRFSAIINRSTVAAAVTLKVHNTGTDVNYNVSYLNSDSVLVIQPVSPLSKLEKYRFNLGTGLKSTAGGSLNTTYNITFLTSIDSSRKFPQLTDNALLDKVQQQTFKYFWDFAHPVSGLARERSNGDNNTIATGGSGFGILALVTGVSRNFITRAQGLARMQLMVDFLKNKAQKIKGAFPHWIHGETGAILPFSANDNGADLVETSYLMQGLLTARQYFNGADAAETTLRADINTLWNNVQWDWFRKDGGNSLYWHYRPNTGSEWIMNMQIKGWNECLITYVLAASSPTHSIPKSVYDNGWASNGSMRNGAAYYGYNLPLGPAAGGPLFLSHYSFLGIKPFGLTDAYANYETQVKNHTLINYAYCKANPSNHFGYSDSVWGLTASDINNGYTASSPTNDQGYIAPTAALSSFPYTPNESMAALKYFYYVLGDKLWKEYGFVDAFSLKEPWFAGSHLAIDQGPIIAMIENYRTGLLWNLFASCPEVKTGMINLGFTAPYL